MNQATAAKVISRMLDHGLDFTDHEMRVMLREIDYALREVAAHERSNAGCVYCNPSNPRPKPPRKPPSWREGDLFCFWNSKPNTIWTIVGFCHPRRPDDPVDLYDPHDFNAADAVAANLGDGTLYAVPVAILNGCQVCRMD